MTLTWATHPDPTGFLLLSNLTKIFLHSGPKAFLIIYCVYFHECGLTLLWSLANWRQQESGNKSLRVEAHCPNLIRIGPENSIPEKHGLVSYLNSLLVRLHVYLSLYSILLSLSKYKLVWSLSYYWMVKTLSYRTTTIVKTIQN